LEVLLDFNQKVIKEMIIGYILYLRDERKITNKSVQVNLSAILRFFQNNNDDFNLRISNFGIHLPPDESIIEDRPYTVEEISQILSQADLRSTMIIHILTSTGMRIGGLHSLQYCDLTPLVWNDNKLYKIQVYARTRDKYYTFCTPECYNAIEDYLNYRRRYGEKITDKSPLIREQFNVDNPFTINSPRFVSEKGIQYLIDTLLQKSGVRKPKEVHMSHGFRKFFMTQCESSPMKSVHVDMLIGHDIGVKKHYYIPKEPVVLEDYMAHAADALTIDPKKRLEKENQELKNGYLAELGDLRHDFNEMKQLLVHLSKDSQKQLVDEFFQKVGDKADIEWSCDD
jgi:site-specific recombinase XerD